MPVWLQIIVVLGMGSIVSGFWYFTRSNIIELRAKVAVIEAEVANIKLTCRDRKSDFNLVFEKLDEVAVSLGRICGKLDITN